MILEKISGILQRFAPISLEQMDSVKLQNRVDTKFLFNVRQLPHILEQIMNDYYVLEINDKRWGDYQTLYFDSKAFELYIKHHNGKLNRYKLRARNYVDSGLYFFEIKFKNNKGRTIKDRIKRPDMTTALEGKPSEFVKKKTPLNPDNYKPRLWVNYSRMTFVNKRSQERLTIDVNLHYLDNTTKVDYDQLVIAEVKQGSARDRSPFIKVMKDYHIAERSISKYCLGVISLNPTIKHNRFKQTILYLKKLLKNERPVLQPISV